MIIERETAERKNGLTASEVVKISTDPRRLNFGSVAIFYCTDVAKIANNTIITSNAIKILKTKSFIDITPFFMP